jgi:hypothetical protein
MGSDKSRRSTRAAMFLFTTPPVRDAAPANPVVDAIRDGAEKTGTSFDYLLATAQRESALDPSARAGTSSASGLFQFVEQTWLGLIKSDGPKLGLSDYADAITAKADGSLAVPDAAARRQILSLRENPQVAALMAGSFTQHNREVLVAELGREPSQTDLYAAHFLGASGAVDLIRTAQQSPRRTAAIDFPEAAAANRSIFYDRKGRARGAGEVYALLGASYGSAPSGAAPPVPAAVAPDPGIPLARGDGPALHTLFQTGGRRGPISQEVARLWRTSAGKDAGVQTAALAGYFPRSTTTPEPEAETPAPGGAGAEAPEAAAAIPAAKPPEVPLPPSRPISLGPSPAREPRGAIPGSNRPLDLSQFMKWRRA